MFRPMNHKLLSWSTRPLRRTTGAITGLLVLSAGWAFAAPPASAAGSSIPYLYGSLPAVGGAAKTGGTVTFGQINGQTPNWILPMTPAADSSVYNQYEFENLLFEPLEWGTVGTVPTINPQVSLLAGMPKYTDGGKTVTFSVKKGQRWSDGKPVDANDVIFWLDLLKAAIKESPANLGNYTPGFLPDDLKSIKATGKYTVQLGLTRSYNPGFFTNSELGLITPIPSTVWNVASANGPHLDFTKPANAKKIYDYLNKASKSLGTYATNPLWKDVDGPFTLTSFTPSTDAFTMVPNKKFSGPVPKIAQLKFETFTTNQAAFNQLLDGNIDVAPVDPSSLPQVSRIKGKYSVYGLPDFGFQGAFYNFKDKTGDWGNVISQTYMRQVFASLEDQSGDVEGLFKTAAVPDYGPLAAAPRSPYTPANATKAPYPYSTASAAKILKAHGWKVVPNGSTTCVKPGTGPGECGANIPAGTKIAPNLFYTNQPNYIGQVAQALAESAKQVGINVRLTSKTFNFLVQNYSVAAAPANNNKWAINDFGGFSLGDYPTTNNIFNTKGSFNFGGWNDPEANKLINNSVYGSDPEAVTKEAQYLTEQQPALFDPAPDFIYAVSKDLSATNVGAFSGLTQFQPLPQDWYFKK